MASRACTRAPSSRRAARPTRGARRRPMIELLEERRMLSMTITVNTLNDPATPVSGQTSLREAIATANGDPGGGDTINFASGLTGMIGLTQGFLPAITADMTITGPGAQVLTVDGLKASRIFTIQGQDNVTISGLTLAHGGKSGPGGAVYNSANLTISDCIITGNSAVAGGGVDNAGSLTISNSAILGNTATLGGGVWEKLNGQLTMVNCTVAGNTASSTGGGVAAYGNSGNPVLTMVNCTVAGNSAILGGGVLGAYAKVTLSDCTVAGNSATLGGGIVNQFRGGGVVTLNNTIVAGNAPGGDIVTRGPLFGSHDLIGDAASAGGLQNGVDGNLVGVDPKLGPLASNGGPTQTMALLPGSPAVRAGDNTLIPAGITTDQRGAPRIKDDIVDIGAFASGPETLVVTTLADSLNPAGPVMSLRDAMTFVNSVEPIDGDAIIFAPGLQGTIALGLGALPPIAAEVTIDFRGSGVLTIDGKGAAGSGILSIQPGSTVDLFGLTLANGSAANGGAIRNTGGTLALSDCTLSGNTATRGGAIYSTGTVTMTRCTLSGNSAGFGGAAFAKNGTVTLTECTVSGNTATAFAGLDLLGDTNALVACTISANTDTASSGGSTAGMYITGAATLNNTIVSGNTGPSGASDLGGPGTASGSNNLIGTGSVSGSKNLLGVTNPMLGPLMFNGGPTQTMLPAATSPALGAGDKTLLPVRLITDQRGAPRVSGDKMDIGAVERQPHATIVVTTVIDEDNGTIDPTVGRGTSLREAIAFANADPGGGDTISFAPYIQGVVNLSLGALPTITAAMAIDGPGANDLTVDGQGQSGIFSLGAGANITISGLTLADGSAARGGGILNTGGTLKLTDCTLSGDTATFGGGIYSTGTATLTGCTLSGNSATSFGGAAFNSLGTMSLTNCTVSGNTAQSSAGLDLIGGTNALVACTVSANTGTTAAAGFVAGMYISGAATLNDTIVAGNTGPSGASDIGGPGTASGSNNLVGTGTVTGSNNQLGVTNPMLGALAWNGGTTQTMALLPGSLAIGKGAGAGLSTDQRGFPVSSPPDIGAFQFQGPPPTVTISGPASATAQVAASFTLTASDPTPSDQKGTFTYTVDWKRDGSDVQTIQGPASMQVAHAYLAAGSFTPIVTVLDQDKRSSSPAALASPVVVQPLTVNLILPPVPQPVTITTTTVQLTNTTQLINGVPSSAWDNSQPVNVSVLPGPAPMAVRDLNIAPTSPNATINVSPSGPAVSPLQTLTNGSGDEPDWLNWARVGVVLAAAIAVTGGAAVALGPAAGVALTLGVGISVASPALEVDQGTVTVSNAMFYGIKDSPIILVKGGTLILENDLIFGTPLGSRPLIEVDGGTLILGGPNKTEGSALLSFGSQPYINVTGGGKVIDNGGNGYAQVASDGSLTASGTTGVNLVSSSPVAVPGQVVTFTATVTASGALAGDGSVEFVDATTGTDLGTAPVIDGKAALPVTFDTFTVGDTIVATYIPTSGALRPSSGRVTQAILAATKTTVAGPTSTPVYGDTVTFTATVTDTTPSGGTPTGSVEFFDGSTDLGPGTPLSGSGDAATSTFSTASLTPGPHTIQAVYIPTGTFQAGSGSFELTVAPRQVVQVAVGFGNQSSIVSPGASRALPWADLASVQITFNGGGSGLKASDFSLIGARFGNYLAGSTFGYDAATQTITLTFAASSVIGSDGWVSKVGKDGDRLTLAVDLSTIQAFSVLPGDYDGNGVVNLVDLNAVRKAAQPGQPYDVFADLNGDGVVNAADVALAVKFAGSKLNLPGGALSLTSTGAAPSVVGAIAGAGAVGAPPTPGPGGTNRTDVAPTGGYAASGVVDLTALAPVRQASLTDMASILLADLDGDGIADTAGSALSLKRVGARGH